MKFQFAIYHLFILLGEYILPNEIDTLSNMLVHFPGLEVNTQRLPPVNINTDLNKCMDLHIPLNGHGFIIPAKVLLLASDQKPQTNACFYLLVLISSLDPSLAPYLRLPAVYMLPGIFYLGFSLSVIPQSNCIIYFPLQG